MSKKFTDKQIHILDVAEEPVSYTHLDVYKRQVYMANKECDLAF